MIVLPQNDGGHKGKKEACQVNTCIPSSRIINGAGETTDLSGPELAIYRFYKAFNNKDITAMTKIWANTEDITAENPAGGIRRGWNELKWVYERVLETPAKVLAEFYDYTIHVAGEVFWSVGRERIFMNTGSADIILNVRITRIFMRMEGLWRLVHLHGSFEDPEMLHKYQQATKSAGAAQA
jgi:ketosteroid isomerase-like protein